MHVSYLKFSPMRLFSIGYVELRSAT